MWGYCIMKMGFKVQVFENNTVIISAYTTKRQICKNSNVIRRHITCSVYRYAYVRSHITSVSLQCVIATYWPGMNNTVFLVIFLDECGSFWQCCHLYTNIFQNQTKTFLFLVHLCCVNIPLVWKQSIIHSILYNLGNIAKTSQYFILKSVCSISLIFFFQMDW